MSEFHATQPQANLKGAALTSDVTTKTMHRSEPGDPRLLRHYTSSFTSVVSGEAQLLNCVLHRNHLLCGSAAQRANGGLWPQA